MKGMERYIMFIFAIVGIVILLLAGIYLAQKGQGLSNPIFDLIKGLSSALSGK